MPTRVSTALVAKKGAFQEALLGWYRREARPLPWREKPTLYKTVVSEFMLQQTQVKTVLPYFARWMSELPDFPALAEAAPSRVLKLWEGLGYYSRARNLHRLAQAFVDLPEPPRSPEDWLPLPGVGPYTAAAIASMAFGARAACVDGNVVRILARLTADGTEFQDSATAARGFAGLANSLLPAGSAGDHNQAMMELGATVCFRRSPLCMICPVQPFCAAARRGDPEAYPRLTPKRIEKKIVCRVWCERRRKLLLHRATPDARRLAGQYELPTADQAGIGLAVAQQGKLLSRKKRGITRFQITESIHRALPSLARTPELVWVPLNQLSSITLSGPHRRWVAEILAKPDR